MSAPLCQCGCGMPALIARYNRPHLGYLRGDYVPFRTGHRKATKPPQLEGRSAVTESGCWEWLGKQNSNGYGRLRVNRRGVLAHRVYYETHVGPIPEGMQLDHLCRNRLCVNPEHLEPVDGIENVRRGLVAKLTPPQVVAIRESTEQTSVLAARYGVGPSTIRDIRAGRRWKGIAS